MTSSFLYEIHTISIYIPTPIMIYLSTPPILFIYIYTSVMIPEVVSIIRERLASCLDTMASKYQQSSKASLANLKDLVTLTDHCSLIESL